MKYKILIVGGGASSLMLASLLAKNSVIIVESGKKLGEKILISGGGKCNITNCNMNAEYFLGDKEFVSYVLGQFTNRSLLAWLKERGLEAILKKEMQYFCKESSREILDLFLGEIKNKKILLKEKVLSINKKNNLFTIKTDKRVLSAEYVVLASGGLSFPQLSASGIGFEIAEFFGHKINKTAPALVGFTMQKEQFFFKELSGTSTEVEIKVEDKVFNGSLLFTHRGLSGPAILNASLYWVKGKIEIDFLANFSWQELKQSKKLLSTILPMPKRVTKAFLLQLNINDKAGCKITSDELLLLKTLNYYTFAPAGTFGYSKAEVTKGGICTDKVDAKTMMSKREDGLYFIGEVLDVTGMLGGYNFQWAFSSAYVCSRSLIERENI